MVQHTVLALDDGELIGEILADSLADMEGLAFTHGDGEAALGAITGIEAMLIKPVTKLLGCIDRLGLAV